MNDGINFQGPDWSVFREWLLDQEQEVFKRLVSTTCDEGETQRLRGRAQFISLLLDLHNNPAA